MLSCPIVDLNVKRDLEHRIADGRHRLTMGEDEEKKLSEEERQIKAEHNEFKKKFVNIVICSHLYHISHLHAG